MHIITKYFNIQHISHAVWYENMIKIKFRF